MIKNEKKYQLFRVQKDKDNYFNGWEPDKLKGLTEDLKDRIYERYKVKCAVFKRDNFKCRNLDCKSPHSDITLHHIRWQKNGGEDKEGNVVTLCDDCHKGYHAATVVLRFSKDKVLPKKIRGQTLKLSKSDEIDWKALKKKMRRFRKSIIPTLKGMDEDELYFALKMLFDEMLK